MYHESGYRIHKLFPLVVYQGEIDSHKEFKEKHLNSLRDYWFNGYENESPEYSGKIFLHKEEKYHLEDFLRYMQKKILQTVVVLSIKQAPQQVALVRSERTSLYQHLLLNLQVKYF